MNNQYKIVMMVTSRCCKSNESRCCKNEKWRLFNIKGLM